MSSKGSFDVALGKVKERQSRKEFFVEDHEAFTSSGTKVPVSFDYMDSLFRKPKLEEAAILHDIVYIHVDGALFGLIMPFVKRTSANWVSFGGAFFFCE
ncbi:hypothetical protein RYX36_008052 [Vicia faba]